MTSISKTIIFFGSGPVAAASLEFLTKIFSVEAVITKAVPPHHKGIAPVEELAKKLNITTIFANNKKELENIFKKHQFKSTTGIVVDYGVIISKEVIDYFKMGIINSHFSLLPELRGADPITFALLSGQEKTGVSLMVIDPTLDTGKLITQKSLAINKNDNAQSLTKRLVDLSNVLIAKYIPMYMDNKITPKAQSHPDSATYSRKISKSDGIIDWHKPAHQIECEIRAYLGWPGSQTTINNHRIIIKKAHISDVQNSPLDMICGDKKYISIEELIAPSGKQMTAADFINGYRIKTAN